ncbi:hypothetical protein PVT68_18200 [Microbulbifer bruguierae]|uniref:Uncharacterized protein n=1 Tax=Microbulbifer bruguierae TaxID=3029061 RepID=A0ABY8NDZ6_9GAMM|nr:hypothetical protein [Microbulbifer bruguierae]WGL16670.1 hypothetical protein PVT68_18200 [Microbulbifer bruguierae]
MANMKAKLLSTKGMYLEALIEIDGSEYCVMDELTLDVERMPKEGEIFEFEFSNMLDEEESWESIFQGNPEKRRCLEQIQGWKYRAYGEVVSINPVKVDCGVFVEKDVIHTHDPKVVGEFVAFTISRLGGYAI